MSTFEDHFLTEVVTDNGTRVWVRGVPPYTMNEVYAKFTRPGIPMITLESDAGSERKMALPGSPEYMRYRDELELWNAKVQKAQIDHHIQYGVVKWHFHWDEAGVVEFDAPKGWDIPASISKYFPNPDAELRRLLFIKTFILISQEDIEAVDMVLYSIKPVEKKDVEAALVPTTSRSGNGLQSLDQ